MSANQRWRDGFRGAAGGTQTLQFCWWYRFRFFLHNPKKLQPTMKYPKFALFLAIVFAPLAARAQTITGETMLNPYFSGGNYTNWSFFGDFRNDGGQDRMVFDLKSSGGNPVGFSGAVGTGKTGSQIAAENSLDANTNYLQGFDFSLANPFYNQIGPFGGTPDGQYNLYFELTVSTTSGNYRAESNTFDLVTTPNGALTPSFTWLSGGGFNGDIGLQNGGQGVALADVTGITYSAIVQTVGTNTTAAVSFATVDNMSLTYQVVPEPGAGALALAAGGLLALRVRRFSARRA